MKSTILLLGSSLFLTTSSIQSVLAAELRPLVLPSTQQGYIQQQKSVKPSSSSIYITFENKVRGMDSNQKKAYENHYTRELDKAVRDKDYERIEHFNQLLRILSRY